MENDMNEEIRKRLEAVVSELIQSKLELNEIQGQLDGMKEKLDKLGE